MTAVSVGGPARAKRAEREPAWVLDGPWQRREAGWPAARILVGLAGIGITWFGCSDTLDWTEQAVWITFGAIALIVALTGVAGWIRTGMRNVRRLERLLLGSARAQFATAALAITTEARVTPIASARLVVTIANGTTYHLPDCLLVTGKPVTERGRDDAARSGLAACGMCQP